MRQRCGRQNHLQALFCAEIAGSKYPERIFLRSILIDSLRCAAMESKLSVFKCDHTMQQGPRQRQVPPRLRHRGDGCIQPPRDSRAGNVRGRSRAEAGRRRCLHLRVHVPFEGLSTTNAMILSAMKKLEIAAISEQHLLIHG